MIRSALMRTIVDPVPPNPDYRLARLDAVADVAA